MKYWFGLIKEKMDDNTIIKIIKWLGIQIK